MCLTGDTVSELLICFPAPPKIIFRHFRKSDLGSVSNLQNSNLMQPKSLLTFEYLHLVHYKTINYYSAPRLPVQMTLGSAAVQSKACISLGEPIDLAGVVSILFCKLVLSYKAMDVP